MQQITEQLIGDTFRIYAAFPESRNELKGRLFASGKKMQKDVPRRQPFVLLSNRIQPSCFWIMPLVTHNPRPVPLSALVVTNGSNTFGFASAGMPAPLSANITRTPRRGARRISTAGDTRTLMYVAPASSALIMRF